MSEMRDRGLWWACGAVGAALAASTLFAFYPMASSSAISSSMTADGVEQVRVTHRAAETLLQHEGPGVLVVLAVPVVIALAAVFGTRSRHRSGVRMVLASMLMLGCMLGAMTVGIFYIPAAVALLLSAAVTRASTRTVNAPRAR